MLTASAPGVEMTETREEDGTRYKVVVNHEEQDSISPASRKPPEGWREMGSKAECLEHAEAVWTDMRPLSLRKAMGES